MEVHRYFNQWFKKNKLMVDILSLTFDNNDNKDLNTNQQKTHQVEEEQNSYQIVADEVHIGPSSSRQYYITLKIVQ